MNQEQRNELFGPEAQFSEHKSGDVISFTEGGKEKKNLE